MISFILQTVKNILATGLLIIPTILVIVSVMVWVIFMILQKETQEFLEKIKG